MCGISGLALRDGEAPDRGVLENMAGAMARRGPDAQGLFVRENIGLGHRRLKIIDLSDVANHPVFNETGDVAVVFNGEIYNFRELRAELEQCGHRFTTRSDTEVIAHAYEQWGNEAYLRFNGIFAFAIADFRERAPKIFLVRDRFGTKPLFYAWSEGRLAFASELKPLFGLPWLGRELDREALYYFLKFSHYPCPTSPIRSIRQLPPGHWLEVSQGEIRLSRYWDPVRAASGGWTDAEERRSEAEWLAELETLVDEVTARQSVSDVPLGCFLSGGIDSTLLASSLMRTSSRPVETFSIGYLEAEFDETPFAAQAARKLGTRHTEIVARGEDFRLLIEELPSFYDQPFADPTVLPTLMLCQRAKEKVTVAVAGDGGDELFFGYWYQEILLRIRFLESLPAPLRTRLFSAVEKAGFGIYPGRLAKLIEILQYTDEEELFSYFIGTVGPMRRDRLARMVPGIVSLPRPFPDSDMMASLKGLPFPARVSQIFLRTFLLDTVLAKGD